MSNGSYQTNLYSYNQTSFNGTANCTTNSYDQAAINRRKNATRETTNTLKAWLYEHRKNPYPTKGEKIMLAIITKMTLTQVGSVVFNFMCFFVFFFCFFLLFFFFCFLKYFFNNYNNNY